MHQISHVYYNKICQFFIRKGNRSLMENIFKDLLFSYAKKGNKNVSSWIESCLYNSMPFVKLKTMSRRRGKRVIYRIMYLKKEEAEKQALISFSKHMNAHTNNSKRFVMRLSQELKSLANNKAHPLRLARDNIHKTALKYAPKSWVFEQKKSFFKVKKLIK